MKIVVATGGFDPLHSGHIEYFKSAKALGDYLIVGVNSDAWLVRKKGRSFMPVEERANIVQAIDTVDAVIAFDETYDVDGSAIKFIEDTIKNYPEHEIVFANGGDRTKENIAELSIKNSRLSFEFGVGGEDKKNSSSWILKEWSQPTTQRSWGTYTVLDQGEGWLTKQLAFEPGKSLSDQRHFKRSEHWHIVEGTIRVNLEFPNQDTESKVYQAGESIDIPPRTWHMVTNVGSSTAKIIEVWLGEELSEDDIERR